MSRQQISDFETQRYDTMSLINAKTISHELECSIEDLYEWIPILPSERSKEKGGKA